ncbi:hypothetical protein GKZ89_07585 [Bacillus mangrovi]|uniref:Intracellular proteinase inhibitor BsuPI domain-containing protein n=1 Tax=Metabacillus mangrovi TaxID=1491830 RepID=A0A7X2S4U9_9BACI|nr:BsuPI-related putative proteinase inhibitor [Metabacillus mangrovi]MTH53273.1 hypothetical protein [Metabacillus mangrovi]
MKDIKLNVSANAERDQAVLKLLVRNDAPAAETVTFPTGQTFELIILDEDGNEVYKYSKGKMFTQAIRKMEFERGEEKVFQERWKYTEDTKPGEYRVLAELTGSSNLSAETYFLLSK